jgi:hypothetical protein
LGKNQTAESTYPANPPIEKYWPYMEAKSFSSVRFTSSQQSEVATSDVFPKPCFSRTFLTALINSSFGMAEGKHSSILLSVACQEV